MRLRHGSYNNVVMFCNNISVPLFLDFTLTSAFGITRMNWISRARVRDDIYLFSISVISPTFCLHLHIYLNVPNINFNTVQVA